MRRMCVANQSLPEGFPVPHGRCPAAQPDRSGRESPVFLVRESRESGRNPSSAVPGQAVSRFVTGNQPGQFDTKMFIS